MVEDLHGRRRRWLIVTVAIVGGLVLGPIDLLAQRTLPYPWANLANSSAVWAISAFGLGAWVGAGRWRPAIASVVLLLVAVESYDLAATLVQHDALANLWTAATLWWLLFGVLAGTVFGMAGAWSRGPHGWRRVVGGGALPGACCWPKPVSCLPQRKRGRGIPGGPHAHGGHRGDNRDPAHARRRAQQPPAPASPGGDRAARPGRSCRVHAGRLRRLSVRGHGCCPCRRNRGRRACAVRPRSASVSADRFQSLQRRSPADPRHTETTIRAASAAFSQTAAGSPNRPPHTAGGHPGRAVDGCVPRNLVPRRRVQTGARTAADVCAHTPPQASC